MKFFQGIDIVSIKRVENIFNKYQNRFTEKIFSIKENKLFNKNKKIKFIANRFAGKEAFVKALGTGFIKDVNIKEISVINDNFGRPYYEISGKTQKFIEQRINSKKFTFNITLSDEKDYVVALATIIID